MKIHKRKGVTLVTIEHGAYMRTIDQEKAQSFSAGEKFGRAEEAKKFQPSRLRLLEQLSTILDGQNHAIEAIARASTEL